MIQSEVLKIIGVKNWNMFMYFFDKYTPNICGNEIDYQDSYVEEFCNIHNIEFRRCAYSEYAGKKREIRKPEFLMR